MVIFDANMILRYLLNDNETMAARAEKYIEESEVYVTIEVIAEVIYVLKGVYSLEKKEISKSIKMFLDLVKSDDMAVLYMAVDKYEVAGLDFVDCVLYAYNRVKGIEIATFDKKLLRLIHGE
jgi:predicted nucleic-acid-binding protein